MQVLLGFLLIVIVGAVASASDARPPRALPLLVLCTIVAGLLLSYRLV